MHSQAPTISVLMPAYNAAKYLDEAIQSILRQTFTDFEFIIINDGSTDETEEIIRSYQDDRIIIINQENKGVAAALNRGLSEARAAWIARFDADDLCYANRLAEQYSFLLNHPDHLIVGSAADYTDMDDNYIFTYHPPAYTPESIRKLKRSVCPFIHSSVLYQKQTIIDAGGYDLNAHGFEDHLLWTSVLNQGKAANIDQPLIRVRLNPESFTIDERWRPRKFRNLKARILKRGSIGASDGELLQRVILQQSAEDLKQASYHALLGKKYLWDNYQPTLARANLRKSWKIKPGIFVVLLWLVSCFPSSLIYWLYRICKIRPLSHPKMQKA